VEAPLSLKPEIWKQMARRGLTHLSWPWRRLHTPSSSSVVLPGPFPDRHAVQFSEALTATRRNADAKREPTNHSRQQTVRTRSWGTHRTRSDPRQLTSAAWCSTRDLDDHTSHRFHQSAGRDRCDSMFFICYGKPFSWSAWASRTPSLAAASQSVLPLPADCPSRSAPACVAAGTPSAPGTAVCMQWEIQISAQLHPQTPYLHVNLAGRGGRVFKLCRGSEVASAG